MLSACLCFQHRRCRGRVRGSVSLNTWTERSYDGHASHLPSPICQTFSYPGLSCPTYMPHLTRNVCDEIRSIMVVFLGAVWKHKPSLEGRRQKPQAASGYWLHLGIFKHTNRFLASIKLPKPKATLSLERALLRLDLDEWLKVISFPHSG